ncbi:DNA recombinase [Alsobacter metallidurans]|uniref:DNA recombination protein RmuC homolog n=1 Tax=Alsobacter metallidurans TaxID=340221 RepID=A0A917I499_9HYPH|nr:DNA recombination protein RmuC [Alsobacter metallidurans]GGH08823.1 DNA recombinase [Alsobacter metallidurans]
MDRIILVVGGHAVSWGEAVIGLLGAAVLALAWLGLAALRAGRHRAEEAAAAAERQHELDEKLAALAQIQSEMTGRMQTIGEVFGNRQVDLVRLIAERLDSLQNRVGDGLNASQKQTAENLSRLNERLAVIDAAQKNLTDLTGEVLSLKDVLSNKQTRGAFGQGRMEAIVRDGLPPGAYAFQATLSSGKRPDCVIHLPGDERPLVVDAKFPLEGFTAFREAQGDDARRAAMQRVRADVGGHIKDVADKYLIPGETQDIAVLFVPAESLFADLQEHFEDLVQRAHRARVLIVSPSLLAMAIQVMQAIVRDARMREQAHQIQAEVAKLIEDVRRLRDRTGKLDQHLRQTGDDIAQIVTSADKALKRGERIEAMEFETPAVVPTTPQPAEAGPLFGRAAE